ncbi:MAG: beta-lactamase family protein [Caenispirillum sp.]|nr:beta-lactamase family protein [Caenispirillum sp.]
MISLNRLAARLVSGLAVCLAAAPAAAQHLDTVDALVQPHVGVDTPGIAVLVTRKGETLHAAGYGFADLRRKTPVDADTLFDLASVSKQMTALAAALQVAEGRLTVDTTVAQPLPVLPEVHDGAHRPITVDDLLHHTAGFADYLDDDGLDYDETTTNAEVLAWLADTPLLLAPGEAFEYSNTGYVVLGSLVAAVDGARSLNAVLQARLFRPLGMTSTALGLPVDRKRRATGYAGTDGDFEKSEWDTAVEGDGTVWTSIADLARYEAALAGDGLITGRTRDALFRNGRLDDGSALDDGDGAGYGWGWSLYEDDHGHRVAAHGGSWYGTATAYRRTLDTGLSVIVLANGEDFDAEDLADTIAARLDR